MAKVAVQTTRIWFDEFLLSSALTSFGQDIDQETPEVGGLSSDGPERAVGNYDFSSNVAGFFDGDSGGIDETLDAALRDGAVHYLAIFPGSASTGTWGRDGVFVSSGEARSGAVAGAVMLDSNHQGAGQLVRANLLENSSKSGTGSGTGRSIGITTSPALTVVTARIISGTFSALDFDIQQSQNDGGGDAYTDVTGLDFAFTGAGVSRKTITATTELWKRVNIDVFTGSSALLVVTIGNAPT